VSTETVAPPPVFDPEGVRSLTGHPDDAAFAVVFITRYRALLPTRVERITSALAERELEDALDAVRSLRAASSIACAQELADIATELERLVRRGEVVQAAMAAEAELGAAVERADRALDAFLRS
jgi:HPt (histidine-containing phosphotransfer) domain-containing protein